MPTISDINYCDKYGATLLMCSAEIGAADVCRALLDKGADPDKQSANGTTALYIAAQNGHD
ncbi:MAG: ankyrin repeat domain-containing protein [Marinilabiliales bacterium]|nr:ankyrin repeat domain-containing protein [Marinilabiliales bacterium]